MHEYDEGLVFITITYVVKENDIRVLGLSDRKYEEQGIDLANVPFLLVIQIASKT